jgi:hypothetical protein
MSGGLRKIPSGRFDKGKEVARGSAIKQAQFISKHFKVLVEVDQKSRPKGWKVKRFREMATKLNNNLPLDNLELNFMDEFYEVVMGKVYDVPTYKKEFYKGHRR